MYAPAEFDRIGLLTEAFRKFGRDEWHGPCPNCGGTDRFVIFTDREFPSWNWWCRVCHPESAWIDELVPTLKMQLSPYERAKFAEENARRREESLKAEIARAQAALEELRYAQSWERYHRQMTDESRQMWSECGVPEFWQDYWKLGYDPHHTIMYKDELWTTPTMTIPIFEAKTWNPLNVRHRLINPPAPNYKYRPEKGGLPASMFVAEPDRPVSKKTLVVEGEKKAMVAYIAADDPELQVVGLPGKSTSDELTQQLSSCDPVYVCMDPDATKEAEKMARTLGVDRVRVIDLPGKIDDLIIQYSLGRQWLKGLLRTGRRVSVP